MNNLNDRTMLETLDGIHYALKTTRDLIALIETYKCGFITRNTYGKELLKYSPIPFDLDEAERRVQDMASNTIRKLYSMDPEVHDKDRKE